MAVRLACTLIRRCNHLVDPAPHRRVSYPTQPRVPIGWLLENLKRLTSQSSTWWSHKTLSLLILLTSLHCLHCRQCTKPPEFRVTPDMKFHISPLKHVTVKNGVHNFFCIYVRLVLEATGLLNQDKIFQKHYLIFILLF